MEVRVTPHSSLSSWDGRGAGQTKAKADGGGGADEKEGWRDGEREREKEKLTKKSERSCQLPTDRAAILKREPSRKEVRRGRGRKTNWHEMRTKEIHEMFLLYRPEIGCREEKEKKERATAVWLRR